MADESIWDATAVASLADTDRVPTQQAGTAGTRWKHFTLATLKTFIGALVQGPGDAIAENEAVFGDSSGLKGSTVHLSGSGNLLGLGGTTSSYGGLWKGGVTGGRTWLLDATGGIAGAKTGVLYLQGGTYSDDAQATFVIDGRAAAGLWKMTSGSAIQSSSSASDANAAAAAILRWGSGSPEGVVTAGVGSLYLRIDGGAATTLYIKETGTGNTGWIAK